MTPIYVLATVLLAAVLGFIFGWLVRSDKNDSVSRTIGYAEGINAAKEIVAANDIVRVIERPGSIIVQRRDGTWWVKYDQNEIFGRCEFVP